MAVQPTPADLQRQVSRLFLARHAVNRPDLLALGLSRDDIAGRLRIGSLEPAYRGVYVLAGAPRTPEQRWAAAVLACGPTAVLSHLSAAALWRLTETDPVVIDVSLAGRSKRRRDGIRVHRPRRLAAADTTEHLGIPVTTVARTLIDLAVVVSARSLERLVDEAEYLGVLDTADLETTLERNEGRAGVTRLRRLLTSHEPGTTRTGSPLEEAFLLLVRQAGLADPLVNTRLGPYTIDFLWPAQRVAVETDGRAAHDRIRARERDYRRDAWLHANGYLPLRFTWTQVTERPGEVLDALRPKLGQRPRQPM